MFLPKSAPAQVVEALNLQVKAMLERFARDPLAPRPWIIDYKGDLAVLMLSVAERIACARRSCGNLVIMCLKP